MVDEYLLTGMMVALADDDDDGQVEAEDFGGEEARRQRRQMMKEKMIVPKKTPKTMPSATAELCEDDCVAANTGAEKLGGVRVSNLSSSLVGREGVALNVVAD